MAQLAPCHLIPLVFQAPQTLLHVRWSTPSANRQPLSPLFKMWSGAVRRDPDNTSVLPMDASDDDIQTPTQTPTSSAVVSLSSSEEVENIPRTSGLEHSAAAPFATKKDSVRDIDENPQWPIGHWLCHKPHPPLLFPIPWSKWNLPRHPLLSDPPPLNAEVQY